MTGIAEFSVARKPTLISPEIHARGEAPPSPPTTPPPSHYNLTFCFGTEPTPFLTSHSFDVHPNDIRMILGHC
jgi:hypothetical protein